MIQPSPEIYWEFMTDIAAPVVLGLAKADKESRGADPLGRLPMLGRYEHDGALRLRSTANIVAGTKA